MFSSTIIYCHHPHQFYTKINTLHMKQHTKKRQTQEEYLGSFLQEKQSALPTKPNTSTGLKTN